ncbi:MAG: hypothetical protein DRR06_17895, partial [Gammaproteobacteria bacterium]
MGLFWPSITAELLYLDDVPMVGALQYGSEFSLADLFLPGGGQGLYYRPVTIATYTLDRLFFNLSPTWMHLENVLLHLGNVLLVWGLSRTLVVFLGLSSRVPLWAGLMFAAHPLATESVNWVSGRTDLLACFFLLSSTWCLVLFRIRQQRRWLLPCGLFLLLSVLSKEVSLAFLPGILLLLMVRLDGRVARTTL